MSETSEFPISPEAVEQERKESLTHPGDVVSFNGDRMEKEEFITMVIGSSDAEDERNRTFRIHYADLDKGGKRWVMVDDKNPQEIKLPQIIDMTPLVIGRDNQIMFPLPIKDSPISHIHAMILQSGSRLQVTHLGRNATHLVAPKAAVEGMIKQPSTPSSNQKT